MSGPASSDVAIWTSVRWLRDLVEDVVIYRMQDINASREKARPVGRAKFADGHWVIEPAHLREAIIEKLERGHKLSRFFCEESNGLHATGWEEETLVGATEENLTKFFQTWDQTVIQGERLVFVAPDS